MRFADVLQIRERENDDSFSGRQSCQVHCHVRTFSAHDCSCLPIPFKLYTATGITSFAPIKGSVMEFAEACRERLNCSHHVSSDLSSIVLFACYYITSYLQRSENGVQDDSSWRLQKV